jgi:hypothetical protein
VLCKNVNSESDVNGKLHIVDPRKDVFVQSQSEGTWIKQAFYLCWGTNHGGHMNTTLICFGGHRELEKRFESLQFHPAWEECIKSPLTLFAILLEELFLILDNQVWTVASVVRDIEWVGIITNAAF